MSGISSGPSAQRPREAPTERSGGAISATMTAMGSRPASAVQPGPVLGGAAVARLAVRQIRRSAVVVVVVAGLPAIVAAQYRSTFGDALDAGSLQALAANPAIRTLFGPPVRLDDPGGFTVWRTGTAMAVLVGVWGLLAATRITRGEEDAGRWDLLLAGRVRRDALVGRHLVVLVAALVPTGAALAVALVAVGTAVPGALLHGAGIALAGVFFAALGVLAAQVLPSRAPASGAAAAVLGTALLLRMVADGVPTLGWLRWLTPFGLLAEVQPYAADRPGPLAVLALAATAVGGLAVLAARRRDLGGGLVTRATCRAPRTRLLGSLRGFAVRRLARPLAGWAVGLGAYFLLIGLLTVSITDFLTANARFTELAATAGFGALGTAEGYTAVMLGLLAVPAGLFTAGRIAATAEAEAQRRLTLLFGLPVSRRRWAGVEGGVTAVSALVLVVICGAALWTGAALVGAPLGLGAALAGALNVLPVALLSLGAAVLALGWAPGAVLAIGALPAAGGFLWQVVAQSAGWPDWVLWISPYDHLAAVPAVAPDWAGTIGMLVVAAALAGLGIAGYTRRDLRG
ncbi:ABC transporter permease [Pseudonocardia sp. H11422]|uniref:ABC transporter permease n=1 Tax=Pseudonocardia sp. H11422 TaxID=2835866 RepID=UPI0020297D9D|nr:ABC transporter permease subunit [Pseudonocardia sp. H11422]